MFFKITKGLPEPTKVEVRYLGTSLKLFGFNALEDEKARLLAKFWRNLNNGVPMKCWEPQYNIKFYNKNEVLLNATMGCGWVKANGFNMAFNYDKSYEDLENEIKKLLTVK